MPEPAEKPLRDQKSRDRALILPLVGVILLLPPVGGIFVLEGTVAGLPATLAYVFGVWALLIAGAAALARRLRDSTGREPD
jgi:hypothetical protein